MHLDSNPLWLRHWMEGLFQELLITQSNGIANIDLSASLYFSGFLMTAVFQNIAYAHFENFYLPRNYSLIQVIVNRVGGWFWNSPLHCRCTCLQISNNTFLCWKLSLFLVLISSFYTWIKSQTFYLLAHELGKHFFKHPAHKDSADKILFIPYSLCETFNRKSNYKLQRKHFISLTPNTFFSFADNFFWRFLK